MATRQALQREGAGVWSPGRAAVGKGTLRTDRWWAYPTVTFVVLAAFIGYAMHPIRYRAWTLVSRLNPYHGNFAWASLLWVALAGLYVRLTAAGVIRDPRVC